MAMSLDSLLVLRSLFAIVCLLPSLCSATETNDEIVAVFLGQDHYFRSINKTGSISCEDLYRNDLNCHILVRPQSGFFTELFQNGSWRVVLANASFQHGRRFRVSVYNMPPSDYFVVILSNISCVTERFGRLTCHFVYASHSQVAVSQLINGSYVKCDQVRVLSNSYPGVDNKTEMYNVSLIGMPAGGDSVTVTAVISAPEIIRNVSVDLSKFVSVALPPGTFVSSVTSANHEVLLGTTGPARSLASLHLLWLLLLLLLLPLVFIAYFCIQRHRKHSATINALGSPGMPDEMRHFLPTDLNANNSAAEAGGINTDSTNIEPLQERPTSVNAHNSAAEAGGINSGCPNLETLQERPDVSHNRLARNVAAAECRVEPSTSAGGAESETAEPVVNVHVRLESVAPSHHSDYSGSDRSRAAGPSNNGRTGNTGASAGPSKTTFSPHHIGPSCDSGFENSTIVDNSCFVEDQADGPSDSASGSASPIDLQSAKSKDLNGKVGVVSTRNASHVSLKLESDASLRESQNPQTSHENVNDTHAKLSVAQAESLPPPVVRRTQNAAYIRQYSREQIQDAARDARQSLSDNSIQTVGDAIQQVIVIKEACVALCRHLGTARDNTAEENVKTKLVQLQQLCNKVKQSNQSMLNDLRELKQQLGPSEFRKILESALLLSQNISNSTSQMIRTFEELSNVPGCSDSFANAMQYAEQEGNIISEANDTIEAILLSLWPEHDTGVRPAAQVSQTEDDTDTNDEHASPSVVALGVDPSIVYGGSSLHDDDRPFADGMPPDQAQPASGAVFQVSFVHPPPSMQVDGADAEQLSMSTSASENNGRQQHDRGSDTNTADDELDAGR